MADRTVAERQFRRMYDEHVDAIRRYFYRRVPASDVDDATIEVFTVVWRRLDSVPDGSGTLPWIFGIARNVLRNQQRAERRRSRLRSKLGWLGQPLAPDPEMQVIRRIEDLDMLRALRDLRPRDREILMLTAWEGLQPREIAEVLGIDPHAASMRLQRARRRLARTLRAPGQPAPALRARESSP